MKISLAAEGLLNPRELTSWIASRQLAINQGVAKAMHQFRPQVVAAVRANAETSLNIKRKAFVRTFSGKVFDRKKNVLPVMYIYNRVPWVGLFERGGTVRGPLLIPLLPTRIGRKKFEAIVNRLLASNNAFFKKVNGKVILFAENLAENGRELGRFRRAEKVSRGVKRLKRGDEIPIAVLVPQVRITRRLRMVETVRRKVPTLAKLIERNLNA